MKHANRDQTKNNRVYPYGNMQAPPIIEKLTDEQVQILLGRDHEGRCRAIDAEGNAVLYHDPLIEVHPRKPNAYYALADADTILNVLHRQLIPRIPLAADNFTVHREGPTYSLRPRICYHYLTTAACAAEHKQRRRAQQADRTPAPAPASIADRFPIVKTTVESNVIPFRVPVMTNLTTDCSQVEMSIDIDEAA